MITQLHVIHEFAYNILEFFPQTPQQKQSISLKKSIVGISNKRVTTKFAYKFLVVNILLSMKYN
jgi:hypothetical protein